MGYWVAEPIAESRTNSAAEAASYRKRMAGDFRCTLKTLTPGLPKNNRGLRDYNPGIGRWVSRDPIGGAFSLNGMPLVTEGVDEWNRIEEMNLYQGAANAFANLNDLLGLMSFNITVALPAGPRRLGPARWLYWGSYFGGAFTADVECWHCWCVARRCRQLSQLIARYTYRMSTNPPLITRVSGPNFNVDTLEIIVGTDSTIKPGLTSSEACENACRAWVSTL